MGLEVMQSRRHQMTEDAPWQSPEDRELNRKRAELASLLTIVTQMETEFLTIQSELSAFEIKYHRIVGSRYIELDLLNTHLGGHGFGPCHDTAGPPPGKTARPTVDLKQLHRYAFLKQGAAARVRPSELLKRIYREVAKRIHPDLGLDKDDRLKRQSLMAQANEAYRTGDGGRLRAILHHWRTSPENVVGDGPGAELVRVIRRIDQVRRRIGSLARKIESHKRSEFYRLKTLIEENENRGRDLLKQMAAILDAQISRSRKHLRALTPKHANG